MAHQPAAEQLLAEWSVPTRGVLRNLPIYSIPPNGLYTGENGWVRDGSYQRRPGLTVLSGAAGTPTLGLRPIGCYNAIVLAQGAFQADAVQNDAFQVAGNVPAVNQVVATPAKIWFRTAAGWTDATDVALTALTTSVARFTSVQLGNVLHVLHTNGIDTPRDLRSDSSVVVQVAGSPPLFTDWVTVPGQARVVGIIPPYDVRWSNIADIGTWPALNSENLSGTPDRLRAIRNLGTLGTAVYKSHSIWVGVITGSATDSAALRHEFRGWYDGPAGPAAVVDALGVHYYMTEQGRVGMFNGTLHQWVADGVLPIVMADIDKTLVGQTFGVWEPTLNAILFFYPRVGASFYNTGLLVVVPPKPEEGIEGHIAFTGSLDASKAVSTGMDLRMDTKDVMLFRYDGTRVLTLSGADDDGAAISGALQTGLKPAPGSEPHRVEGFEVFAERGAGFGSLDTQVAFSNLLDTPSGSLSAVVPVSLASSTAVKDIKGADVRGRFFGLRAAFSAAITLRYKGARIMGRRTEQ